MRKVPCDVKTKAKLRDTDYAAPIWLVRAPMTPQKAWKISRCSGMAFLVTLALTFLLARIFWVETYSRLDRALAQIDAIGMALDRYKQDHGNLPSNDAGLDTLMTAGYIDHVSHDPWGSPYIYQRDTSETGYRLYSSGVNRIDEGGSGDDVTDRSKHYSCKTYGINCPGDLATRFIPLLILLTSIVGLIGFLSFGAIAIYSLLAQRFSRSAPC